MKRILLWLAMAGMMLTACEKAPDGSALPDGVQLWDYSVDALRPVLQEFYDATGGPEWPEQPNWMEEDDIQKWNYVTFASDVGELYFDAAHCELKGTIPASFFDLPFTSVNLKHNELSGELPSNVGANGLLLELDVRDNDLSGNLPESLAKSCLESLDVRENQFTGEIPEVIKGMVKFKEFDFDPQQEGYGLTGFESVKPLAEEVRVLMEFFNRQSEEVQNYFEWDPDSPESWAGVTWDGFGRCRRFKCFDEKLQDVNYLLQNLPALAYLDLYGCTLNEILDFGKAKELVYLDIAMCELTDFPEGVENMKSLRWLDISDNYFRCEIPATLNGLSSLEYLNLTECEFTGKIPVLDKLYKLRFFDCELNETLDVQPLPEWIGQCPNMNSILMNDSNFSGNLPESWKKLSQLTILDLNYNLLNGNIQHYFAEGGFKSLEFLDLSHNLLKGSLPEFSEDNVLLTLHLNDNDFTNDIPDNWQVLKSCSELFIQNNYVTGTIPVFFKDLKELFRFVLEDNMMAGTIQKELTENKHFGNWSYFSQRNGKLELEDSAFALRGLKNVEKTSVPARDIRYDAIEEFEAALKAELLPEK